MKLWLLTQNEYNGWDSYDSAVVAAKDEKTARSMHPQSGETKWLNCDWATCIENVKAECIGTAVRGTQQSVICASFNAG